MKLRGPAGAHQDDSGSPARQRGRKGGGALTLSDLDGQVGGLIAMPGQPLLQAGRFGVGSGEKADREALKLLPSGSFVHLPAGMPHYAAADVETVVQINGVGPFDVTYINPQDDPRKR